MKKYVYLLFTLVIMTTLLIGCGDDDADKETQSTVETTTGKETGTSDDEKVTSVDGEETDTTTKDENLTTEKEDNTTKEDTTTKKEETTTKKEEETTSKTPEPDKNKASYGTIGAKIILARERLNNDKLRDFSNVLAKNDIKDNTMTASIDIVNVSTVYADIRALAYDIKENVANANKLSGNRNTMKALVCTSFPDYCNYKNYYSTYMNNMDNMIERNSTLIDYIKNYVNITDKWIVSGNESYLLQVDGNSETVYVKSEYGYSVFKRYANESAQNVYELYVDDVYDTGTTKIKFLCIPGLRYEYTENLNHSEEGNLTLIADPEKGYWNFFLISGSSMHANITKLIMLDDIYYEASHYVNIDPNCDVLNPLRIMTADFKYDVLSTKEDTIELCLNGFTGVSSVTGVSDSDNGNIILSNGKKINAMDTFMDGKISMFYAQVGEMAEIGLYPTVGFRVEGNTLEERFIILKQFLDEVGIKCKTDFDNIINKTISAEKLAASFKSTQLWKGKHVRTYAEVSAGFANEKAEMSAIAASYNKIKNAPIVSEEEIQAIPREVFFTKIVNPQHGTVTYENGTISIKDMSFTLADNVFVENGVEYTIGLELVKVDELGALSYEEAVVLETANAQKTKCTDRSKSFTVTQNATYQISDALFEGDYILTAYVATADGIRISEMVKVVMSQDAKDEINKDITKIIVKLNSDKNMVISYVTLKDITIEYKMEKDSYTYEEVNSILIEEALKYGYPTDKGLEQLGSDGATWSVVAADATMNGGTIRLTYYVDQETKEEGHIICKFSK